MVTGDGSLAADGQEIYTARGLKVGLFSKEDMMRRAAPTAGAA